MSECSLSGRGQGHVSNLYIVDFENFVTASSRYTGDIHNSTGVFVYDTYKTMKATRTLSRLSAHVYYTSAHLNPPMWSCLSHGVGVCGYLLTECREH